ncbi:hypothetical protein [Aurantiacibacter flavus]|uniref:Uncharacterized protein n=1 Tax=Aurantiacibacter flavus TaxID=3145232 RepID=A0ABV0D1K3_9SPHN
MGLRCTAFVAAILALTPLAGQAQERIDLDPAASWEHPHSHVVVPAKWGGLSREEAIAFAEDFLNVGFQFETPDTDELLSLYLFRQTSGAVPVWMAQAQAAITARGNFGIPIIVGSTEAFMPPGQSQASGLKAVFRLGDEAPFRSTGVALFAVDGWLVKVRASSARRTPVELEQWMQAAISELDLPTAIAPVAMPVVDCKAPLSFDDAVQDAPEDIGANLLGGLMNDLLLQEEDKSETLSEKTAAAQWCIDSTLDGVQTIYRADEQTDGYLLALGDSGVAVQVYRDTLSGMLSEPGSTAAPRFNIALHNAKVSTQFAAQDRLPSPQRVAEVINARRVVSRTTTWGDKRDIEITAPAED